MNLFTFVIFKLRNRFSEHSQRRFKENQILGEVSKDIWQHCIQSKHVQKHHPSRLLSGVVERS